MGTANQGMFTIAEVIRACGDNSDVGTRGSRGSGGGSDDGEEEDEGISDRN